MSVKPASRQRNAAAPSRRSGGGVRPYLLARRFPVILGASAVFVAAFILDTEAVAKLFWSCLAGQEGSQARIVGFAVLLALCVIASVLYRSARQPPAKPRKKAAKRSVRDQALGVRKGATDGGPADEAPAIRRRRTKDSQTATDQPR